MEIIGVVGDIKYQGLDREHEPVFYQLSFRAGEDAIRSHRARRRYVRWGGGCCWYDGSDGESDSGLPRRTR